MRKLLTVIWVILLIAGLIFAAQGSGYYPLPAESFMINQTRWVYYGAVIALPKARALVEQFSKH